ncbi:MAG: DNA polymerase III subunit delta [Chloroflexi bacterium]|nr:DNA polymerase III subunit delta [Chloroflexota bacterium]
MSEAGMRVLFLYGSDEFAISRRLSKLRAAVDKDGMNTSRLEARLVSENDLNTAVNAAPFLAERRLVILSNPSARYTTPSARKKFIRFLENTPPTTMLVMHETLDDKKAARHWLVKWAQKAGKEISAERFMMPRVWKTTEWIKWIQKETKEQGGEMEPRAAARLAEMVGENTRQAAQEITKLLTYVNYERPVTLGDVEQVSVATAQGDIFALVDALGDGKGRDAQAMLHRLLDEQDPFSIFGMVVRQFRLLLLAREVMDAGGGVRDVQSALQVHEFVAKKVAAQARRFSLDALEAIYRRLLKIDEAAKTSRVALDLSLDMLVMELAGKP